MVKSDFIKIILPTAGLLANLAENKSKYLILKKDRIVNIKGWLYSADEGKWGLSITHIELGNSYVYTYIYDSEEKVLNLIDQIMEELGTII